MKESNVFGQGARDFGAAGPGDPWLCRSKHFVTDALLMGPATIENAPLVHTLVFWVYPSIISDLPEDMTICCQWSPNASNAVFDKCSYWLGLVEDENGARFTYKGSWSGHPADYVVVRSDVIQNANTWYRVAAQFGPDGQGGYQMRLGVGSVGSDIDWADPVPFEDYQQNPKDRLHRLNDGSQFQIGGAPEGLMWRGRITHGYYYRAAISDDAINAIVGSDVTAPVGYDTLLTDPPEHADVENLESLWPLDEPSCRYAYDELGNNNMHWAFWSVGAAPISGGYPGIRLVRSSAQHFTCHSVAPEFAGTNVPMTLLMLVKLVRPNTSGQLDGLIGLGYSGSSMPYRMWCHYRAYHRDYNAGWSPASMNATANMYAGADVVTEDVLPQLQGKSDAAQHVLCTVWGPHEASPCSVTLYVDDPLHPATETQSLGDLRSMPFDRFSIGAVHRADQDGILYPMDGYIGMVVVVKKALSSGERLLLMQWMKEAGGLT